MTALTSVMSKSDLCFNHYLAFWSHVSERVFRKKGPASLNVLIVYSQHEYIFFSKPLSITTKTKH